jgi:hypothetical protein
MNRPMRWVSAVGVGLVHLALLRGCQWPAWRADPAPAQPPLSVRLLSAPEPVATPAQPRFLPPRWAPAREPRTQAITIPTLDAVRRDDAPPPPAAAAASAANRGTAAPPLDLRLPPAETRGAGPVIAPAAPRPQGIESRLSTDLATGPLREQSLGQGTLRLRQGRRCVELRDANIARIDPFNQSVSPVPKQAEDCSR